MTSLTIEAPTSNTIEQTWQRIKDSRTAYNATPDDDEAAEKRHWAFVDAAEREIHENEATTLLAVEIKLWLTLCHSFNYKADERDVLAEDVASLDKRDCTFDWTERLRLSAIKSLRAMEA